MKNESSASKSFFFESFLSCVCMNTKEDELNEIFWMGKFRISKKKSRKGKSFEIE